MNWKGVIPAITTNLDADLAVDHAALAVHCRWMIDSGCTGIVCCGSLGEAQTLSFEEKIAVVRTSVAAVGKRAPVVAGIASLSTTEAVALAEAAAEAGAKGLMVLPPYVYSSDWQEMKAHVSAVIGATKLSCMLYNNPAAYKTDFLPVQIAELADEHSNLHAVKESSGDVRRVTAIRAVVGRRLEILVGMDDAIVESIYAGAVGWIAGLVNAFPAESVALFDYASRGDKVRAAALYEWFLPLLRLDTVPKFVQLIKWVQTEMGHGTPHVRPPRLPLTGADLDHAKSVLRVARKMHPKL
ncbi:MAG: dihydrodipicolinate synthase family protein [bacterium]|nr:dihydrodipicolinate synthase family protein [bacterium]MDI1336010.1 dihydrodipicolinate synthase family protein [Lacunisphaera sp.]